MKTQVKKNADKIVNQKAVDTKDLPEDVKEALDAMERTKATRLNRPIFEMPLWAYAEID